MKQLLLSLLACAGLAAGTVRAAAEPSGLPTTYRNLFVELLGKSPSEVDAKLNTAWRQLFYGDNENERVYFPVGKDEGRITDIGHEDVRSEGMSYGMMIAVQLDHREEFDRLWQWAKNHMYHASGPRHGYFAWQCRNDGTQMDPGSASDGEEWMTTALFFASHRWGDRGGIFNYGAEAQALLNAMRDGARGHGITAIFDPKQHQPVFAPSYGACDFTDPSYHLPAFYELWARWDATADGRAFWAACARNSRAFFKKVANPVTGLMPEYAHFDGSRFEGSDYGGGKSDFRYDAWRVFSNVAIDASWFDADPWEVEQSNRALRFLTPFLPDIPTEMTLDGKPLSHGHSSGLPAMAAVAGLAGDAKLARPFVENLWNARIPTGMWRYYDGLLYFLGMLETSGHFRVYPPASGR